MSFGMIMMNPPHLHCCGSVEFTLRGTDDIEDGMTVLDEEIAEESHGSRPYVLLIERLINDGWEILPSAPQTGTFVRNRE